MAVLKILTYPNEILRKKTLPVTTVDDEVKKLVNDMAETMYSEPGVGLAANQVGVLKRVVVIDIEYTDGKPNLIVLINPEIVEREGTSIMDEGCLSLPGINEPVERSASVKVKALGIDGNEVLVSADGFFSHAVQHELDHLDGKLFIDHLSFLKRKILFRELTKKKHEK
jgi:peptide deformylase